MERVLGLSAGTFTQIDRAIRMHGRADRRTRKGDLMTAIIETDKLTKSYGEHRGIIDVDLAIEKGEVFGSSARMGPARRRRSGCCWT